MKTILAHSSRPRAGMLKLVMAAAFAVMPVLGCSSTKSCTEIGCGNQVSLDGVVAVGTDDIEKYVITMCRNTTCSTATPTVVRAPCGPGVYGCATSVTLMVSSGTLEAFPSITSSGLGDTSTDTEKFAAYRVSVTFFAFTQADVDALKDGDTYSLKVTRVDGSTPAALDVTETATYKTTYPNGVECGPACKSVTLQ